MCTRNKTLLREIKGDPFKQTREIVHVLGLKSQYCQDDLSPQVIPKFIIILLYSGKLYGKNCQADHNIYMKKIQVPSIVKTILKKKNCWKT